ncbi:ABC transporter substrate-binding protein [Motilimonas sp. 1_MG-2023]|uniref:ABC transporter substrate-binding protein n=1 Tax=Motilimonas sp. 1_MG-2023 TaxID=3062672 RepID=UPI0026E46294|nr:ABC transporter substrate-binding protein [Motilimonas sp. 1_MG-2023]MDO6525631.1 ABC transporter substrate-binding protein [Motilimonas sp. 1_MG-2023]
MKKYISIIGLISLMLSYSVFAYDAEITFGVSHDPVSLDIHESLSEDIVQFSHLVFDPLIRRNQKLQYVPRLAEKWRRIDPLTVRFTLRSNVKFHSGNPLTSHDVKWTLVRLKSSADYKGLFERVDHIKIIDGLTFDLITKTPYPLVNQLASYLFVLDSDFYTGVDENGFDKSRIVKQGNTFAATHVSGTGPYQVALREKGMQLRLVRFQDYWDHESLGNITKLTLIPIREPATRLAALLSGDVDMISPVAPKEYISLLEQPRFTALTWPGTTLISLQLNQSQNAALKDRRVRQAIIYAINNQGIAEQLMQGFATSASQQSPPGYVGHNPYLSVRYDLAKARQLMKQAGYEKGLNLAMIAPQGRYINDVKVAQAVVAMLQKINIKVTLNTFPINEYWPEFDRCNADILMIGWQSDTRDSANFSEYLTMTRNIDTGRGQYNCGHYSNPKVDEYVIKANREIDPMLRGQLLREVELMLYEDAAFVPLHWERLGWAAKKNIRLKDVVNPDNTPYLGDIQVDEFENPPSLPLLRSRRQ